MQIPEWRYFLSRLHNTLVVPVPSILHLVYLSPYFHVSNKAARHSPLHAALDEEVGVLVLKHLLQVQPVMQRRIAGLLVLELQRLIYDFGLLLVAVRRHGYVARARYVKTVIA